MDYESGFNDIIYTLFLALIWVEIHDLLREALWDVSVLCTHCTAVPTALRTVSLKPAHLLPTAHLQEMRHSRHLQDFVSAPPDVCGVPLYYLRLEL